MEIFFLQNMHEFTYLSAHVIDNPGDLALRHEDLLNIDVGCCCVHFTVLVGSINILAWNILLFKLSSSVRLCVLIKGFRIILNHGCFSAVVQAANEQLPHFVFLGLEHNLFNI